VLVIPSIDLTGGRSRVVFWPGVSAGTGAPTDRPERIARRFVDQGASVIHLVDMDGARAGSPAALEAIGLIAAAVAVPIQVAGGLEDPDAIRLAFAAGATRAVLGMSVVQEPQLIRECLAVAGDWLAIGIDPRPERFAAFPWRRATVPTLAGLAGELAELGVRRLILSHGGSRPDLKVLSSLASSPDMDVLVAGGVTDLDAIRRLRDAGVAAIILGEPLLSGAIEYTAAREAAA
jgi:phosphoribosylformimino-5-aminoimidazole carboxamide ribotide isomerase